MAEPHDRLRAVRAHLRAAGPAADPHTVAALAEADQLAKHNQRLIAGRARMLDERGQARLAFGRLQSHLIAVAPYLDHPYTDAPEWTPWTRFILPALRDLRDELHPATTPIGATSETVI